MPTWGIWFFLQLVKLFVESEVIMKSYKCLGCDYIYNPAKGDSEAKIPAGTSFNDLPEDWCCPVCGIDKSSFEEI